MQLRATTCRAVLPPASFTDQEPLQSRSRCRLVQILLYDTSIPAAITNDCQLFWWQKKTTWSSLHTWCPVQSMCVFEAGRKREADMFLKHYTRLPKATDVTVKYVQITDAVLVLGCFCVQLCWNSHCPQTSDIFFCQLLERFMVKNPAKMYVSPAAALRKKKPGSWVSCPFDLFSELVDLLSAERELKYNQTHEMNVVVS